MMSLLPVLSWSIFFAVLAAVGAYRSFRRAPHVHSRGVAAAESLLALIMLIPALIWVGAKFFHVRVDIFPVLALVIAITFLSRWRSH